MGEFVNPAWIKGLAYSVAIPIAVWNAWLLIFAARSLMG
jgi:hypothetical protein